MKNNNSNETELKTDSKDNKIIFNKNETDIKNSIYAKYSENELIKLCDNKNQNLISRRAENKQLKEVLTKTITDLNEMIKQNSAFLFKEKSLQDETIENLKKIFDIKKHDHLISMRSNNTYKKQYAAMLKKQQNCSQEKITEKYYENRLDIEKMKKENLNIKQEMAIIKEKNTKQYKNMAHLDDTKISINAYSQQLNNFSTFKYDYKIKIMEHNKKIDIVRKQLTNVEKFKDENIKLLKLDGKIEEKINNEINSIKTDLQGTNEEVLEKIYNTEENNYKKLTQETINKGSGRSISQLKELRLKPIKRMEHSQSELTINGDKEIISAINKKYNKFTVLNKFKILRESKSRRNNLNNNTIMNMGSNDNETALQQRPESMFITKEVIDFNKPKRLDTNSQLEDEEYKSANFMDYQQLNELKDTYLDMNDRLNLDIKERQKTFEYRIKKLYTCIEDNQEKLNYIKSLNDNLKIEINELNSKLIQKSKKSNPINFSNPRSVNNRNKGNKEDKLFSLQSPISSISNIPNNTTGNNLNILYDDQQKNLTRQLLLKNIKEKYKNEINESQNTDNKDIEKCEIFLKNEVKKYED